MEASRIGERVDERTDENERQKGRRDAYRADAQDEDQARGRWR